MGDGTRSTASRTATGQRRDGSQLARVQRGVLLHHVHHHVLDQIGELGLCAGLAASGVPQLS